MPRAKKTSASEPASSDTETKPAAEVAAPAPAVKPRKAAKKAAPVKRAAGAKKPGPKPTAGGQSASEFIRAQPTATPAKAVVAAGAKAGLKFSDALVYKVRGAAKKKARKVAAKTPVAKKAASTTKAVAPKKPSPTKAAGKLTASGFIRSQPRTVPAKDVIALGAKEGFKFSANLVYAVRSAGSTKAAPKPVASTPTKPAATTRAGTSDTSPETILARLVLAHGFGRVEEMLAAAGKRVESLLAGT